MKSLSSEVNSLLPVIVCFAGCIVCSRAAQRGPAAPSPAGQTDSDHSAPHSRMRPTVPLRVPTARAPHLLSGCWPARQAGGASLLPGTRVARHRPRCGAGVSQRLIPEAPKIAVTSTHLEPRPVAFWQAEAEIFARLLLSINCWALQIKASSVRRGFAGGLSLASTRGAWSKLSQKV